ncbi:hypothetical protein Syun_009373 [Stephania yunnanensis]|uniref:Pentatricopeptide repeat-containing protein n=1 Tax=Stephania yunnanensis TaxID=152371 RepID=A0AAP0KGI2_9MAGN
MRKYGVIPNEFTLAAVISGRANLGEIEWGEQLHGHVLHMGLADSLSVANAIVVLYSKCEILDSSSMLFHGMVRRDVITWSTIIVGYSQAGHCEEAFRFFSRMRREGPKPNEVTLASLLSACGNVVILEQGKQLHALVLSLGLDEDVLISSALINMYSKCGSIVEALRIFEATGNEEIVSWIAMINGFAEHGHSKEAIDLFEREKESERDFAMRERGDEEEKKSLQKFLVEAKRWRRLSTYIGLGSELASGSSNFAFSISSYVQNSEVMGIAKEVL